MAALVLLPVAAASLVGHIDTLRVEALALAAIMTSLLVLADLTATRTGASQLDQDQALSRAAAGLAAPVRPARPREIHLPTGRAHPCILCGAASDAPSAKPTLTHSFQDILLPAAGLHMAANDDARADASKPDSAPLDEDRDFWTEEIGLAPRHGPPERAALLPPAALAAAYTGSLVKQALDTLAACLALLALAPLLAAIWVTLKVAGGGPAFIHTSRPAWSDRLFRTAVFATSGPPTRPISPPLRALMDEYLRRTGLCHLPLLLSVAAGHLSFVGPDPGRPCETTAERAGAAIVAELAERLLARPGLAGSASIHAALSDPALPATHAALVICDLFYLEHATPLLDLRVLAGACACFWARPRR